MSRELCGARGPRKSEPLPVALLYGDIAPSKALNLLVDTLSGSELIALRLFFHARPHHPSAVQPLSFTRTRPRCCGRGLAHSDLRIWRPWPGHRAAVYAPGPLRGPSGPDHGPGFQSLDAQGKMVAFYGCPLLPAHPLSSPIAHCHLLPIVPIVSDPFFSG